MAPSAPPADPEGLETYFTDVEHLRDLFGKLIAAPALPKRLLVIHGVGGVGKSSLLRMFRLHCKRASVPVAIASGDEERSAADVLDAWANTLKAGGVKLPTFAKTLALYHTIQAKAEERAQKAQSTPDTMPSSLVGALGGMSAEALIDWLSGFLKQPDIALLLDPANHLTKDFLSDITRAATRRRIVLMLDTFEQMTALEDWARELAQRLHPNTLLVLAGRTLPNWSRRWENWMLQAEVQELKPMTADIMRELVGRYYMTIRGGAPDLAQVEAIIGFSRGLPVVVTSAVRLWVQYGVEDFQAIKPQVVADLVDRLLEGVPPALVPALEAAAAVRWFNKDILRAAMGRGNAPAGDQYLAYETGLRQLLARIQRGDTGYAEALVYQQRLGENIAAARLYGDNDTRQTERATVIDRLNELALATLGVPFNTLCDLEDGALGVRTERLPDINAIYDELRRFPFVRPRAEGLALHDAVREIIDENLRVHEPARHRLLHERAAIYFEARLAQVAGPEAERLGLERLYHRVRADEAAGIQLFQEMAEELARYRLVSRLRLLLNDVNTYPLELENSLWWRNYYKAQLAYLEYRYQDAEPIFEQISVLHTVEPKLRSYALSDLAKARRRIHYIAQPGGLQKLIQIIERSNAILPEHDYKRARNISLLGDAYRRLDDQEYAVKYYKEAITLYQKQGDLHGVVGVMQQMKQMYAMCGDWRNMLDIRGHTIEEMSALPNATILHSMVLGDWSVAVAITGRYAETERDCRRSIEIEQRIGENSDMGARGLIFSLGMQGRYSEAQAIFCSSLSLLHDTRPLPYARYLGFWSAALIRQGDWLQAEAYLIRSLQMLKTVEIEYGYPENYAWLGQLYEIQQLTSKAYDYYQEGLAQPWTQRRCYFKSTILTSLVRVKHAQGDHASIPPLLAEAEQLAQQYEYNDHLAALRLTQAYLAWECAAGSEGESDSFEAALDRFGHAMIHALRYNRFLLDEVLWGGAVCTPLQPIIPSCLERGAEGRRMLAVLDDWWRSGTNDIGAPRPDTISPIPEGISLLEAERIAREREPGDGQLQQWVHDRIAAALETSTEQTPA